MTRRVPNPAFLVALVRASTFTLALSNTTVVSRLGRLDLTSMTPSIRVNANLTVIGQVGQFIPGTERTALCWAAQLGPMSSIAAAGMIHRFIAEPFIQ